MITSTWEVHAVGRYEDAFFPTAVIVELAAESVAGCFSHSCMWVDGEGWRVVDVDGLWI